MMPKTLALLALFFLCFALPASAAEKEKPVNVDLASLEKRLNSITTLRARFQQIDASGQKTTGRFYLSRPGKLRFEYDPPVDDFIVADGVFIYFYDSKMNEQSQTLISQSLADFILRKNLNLSGDIKVTQTTERNGLLFVSLAQANDLKAGTITLGLQLDPFLIRGWRIKDAANNVTEILLTDIETGGNFSNSLFTFTKPKNARAVNR
jgi:outer membrane lipoprotein-sorting protein